MVKLGQLWPWLRRILVSVSVFLLMACGTSVSIPEVESPPANSAAPPVELVKLGSMPALTIDACTDFPVTAVSNKLMRVSNPRAGVVRFHYQRSNADYSGWGLHAWNSSGEPGVPAIEWNNPLLPAGDDGFGVYYDLNVSGTSGVIGYLFHKGDEKDHNGADQSFDLANGTALWRIQDDAQTYLTEPGANTPPPLPDNVLRIHYQRLAADYTGWGLHAWNQAGSPGVPNIDWNAPLQPTGSDDFGQYFDLPITQNSGTVGYLFHKGDDKDHGGADQNYVLGSTREIWRKQNDLTTYLSNPDTGATTPDNDHVRVHYKRFAGDYSGYGLHIWEIANGKDIDSARLPSGVQIGVWDQPVPFAAPMPTGSDSFGVWIDVPVKKYSEGARGFNFIVHKGTDDAGKDGGDRVIAYSGGYEVWLVEGDNTVHYRKPRGDISTRHAKAFWVNNDTILWPRVSTEGNFRLYYNGDGGITANDQIANATGYFVLNKIASDTLSQEIRDRYAYIGQNYVVLRLPNIGSLEIKRLMRTQLVLARTDSDGMLADATTPQIAGVLDNLYASAAENIPFGVTLQNGAPSFKVWAPTALNVSLCIYDQGNTGSASVLRPLGFDDSTGTWSILGAESWTGKYYRYLVDVVRRENGALVRNVVTDPYSAALSANSQRTWIGDLNNANTKPANWDSHAGPTIAAPEDLSIYEMHVRDFSANDASVSTAHQGKYKAFTESNSDGMRHLKALADSGLTLLHLLPVNDIATVPEIACESPAIPDAPADSELQQAAVNAVRDDDCFNWGYDPLHYNAPEGSYATDASDPAVRVREFREMVAAIHNTGLQVALDVVYNHTPSSGQNPKSILDRIVPDYYHRLDVNGNVTNSSCCSNTATEHAMMAKLMIDSAVLWAKEYKIDSFRFDLMGHIPLSAIQKLKTKVDAATGRNIYLYGEGWNFGEVVNNSRFVQAAQNNLAGTGIGSFNDRIRDIVRGGGPFDDGNALVRNQGIANGLYLDNNGQGSTNINELLHAMDILRVNLAGNLKGYSIKTYDDQTVRGDELQYSGGSVAYVSDPQESINYVDKHDNQTLFDINAYKLPETIAKADRVRMQNLGVSFVTFAQGIPFLHAGMDLMRSKSMDRDSYNSGDWFNKLDWSAQDNNFAVGAPIADKNQSNWYLIKPRLSNPMIKPEAQHIAASKSFFQEALAIRKSSSLFRMRSEAEINQRLSFANTGSSQVPGVIVMLLDGADYAGANYRRIAVVFNVDKFSHDVSVTSLNASNMQLHPVQQAGADSLVKAAQFNAGTFSVPARTVAVFVEQE